MPAADVIMKRFALRGEEAWLDPADTSTPTIPAAVAWKKLARKLYGGGGRAQLLLGYYTSSKNGVTQAPVFAWTLFVQNTSVPQLTIPTDPVPRPDCVFGTAYSVLNATTGQPLITRYDTRT